jgi:hypothetical protein
VAASARQGRLLDLSRGGNRAIVDRTMKVHGHLSREAELGEFAVVRPYVAIGRVTGCVPDDTIRFPSRRARYAEATSSPTTLANPT